MGFIWISVWYDSEQEKCDNHIEINALGLQYGIISN